MNDFSRFFALIKQLPHADKETLVNAYSGGTTASLREFKKRDPRGFGYMLASMQASVDNLNRVKTDSDAKEAVEKRRYRSLILKAMQAQGVMVRNCDWSDVNDFVERYAGAGKSLLNMSLEELKKFNNQVYKLLDWHNAQKEARLRQAIMN